MNGTIYLSRAVFLSLLMAGICAGQERELERVTSESARLRQAPPLSESSIWKEIKALRDRSAGFHSALRDWFEAIIPMSKTRLDAEFPSLNLKLNGHLQRAGLTESGSTPDEFKPGSVSRMEVSRPTEDPDNLIVIVGVGVPCGNDDVVYIYDYSQGLPRRVLESHGTRDHDESVADVRLSKHDAAGGQLDLILRYAVQCGSSWNLLSYDLFRLSPAVNNAAPILSGEQGIWFGAYDPFQIRLEPDELLMEVRDRSIDSGVHNRAYV